MKNCKEALIGGTGGLIGYLYHYALQRDKVVTTKFDIVRFLINGLVGSFMAYCFGDTIPMDLEWRNGVIGFIGVSGFGLMGALESEFVRKFLDKFTK